MNIKEMQKCAFCGKHAEYQLKNGKWCCHKSPNQCPEKRRKLSEYSLERHKKLKEKYGKSTFVKHICIKQPLSQIKVCFYCGGHAEFQLKNGKWCCKPHVNSCPKYKIKMSEAIKKAHMSSDKFLRNPEYHPWNKGLTSETSIIVKKIADKQRGTHKKGHPHTKSSKMKLRQHALQHGLGGFNMRKKGFYYNGIKLDSSYEVIVAKSLDDNGIKWNRPKRFPYHINGVLKHYTPDFFLPDYNVFLDPKNDFLINNINPKLGIKDIDKLKHVESENHIKVIILDKHHLTWENILKLL